MVEWSSFSKSLLGGLVTLPQIKSQMKRMKIAEKQRVRNKSVKSALKTYISNFDKAMSDENKELTKDALAKAVKSLDKAVSKGVIHKNKAANSKSRLTRRYNVMPETPIKAEAEAVGEITEEKKVTKKGAAKKKATVKKPAAAAKKTTKAKTTEEKPKTTRKSATAKKADKKAE